MPLEAREGTYCCSKCGDRFPILRGIPRLLSRDLREQLLLEGDGAVDTAAPSDPSTQAKLKTAASFGFEWQRFHQMRDEWERNFLEYMQPREPEFFRGKRVLDAGCGTGRHTYYAAKFGADVTAVDLSEAIEVAHKNTRGFASVRTVQADLYRLPFALESFDFVYSIGVLHHLPDPEGAFRNLLRYVKPGGEIQIYLYWWPEHQPLKAALLRLVRGMRFVTTRWPHSLLYGASYPIAIGVYLNFVLPYKILHRLSLTRQVAERIPLRQYASYPFQVCVNDQFDRFSAPIENRYTREEVKGWLERAGLEDISVLPNWGWLGSGRKPLR